MTQQKRFSFLRRIFICLQLFNWTSVSLIGASKVSLTPNELREKYGQENTTFNDERSCHRVCDGQIRTCYYEFDVQFYDTMSGLCGSCDIGTISDCFKSGCITANGVPRTVMTVNRQIPGPIISCCRNDRIIVDLNNHMGGQELTFHWHGLHQKNSPWFDGVPMVTQCPIASGNSFRYIFNAAEEGTHLYHAHSGLHRMNGLYGSLIVREPDDPNANLYDYDLNENLIVLSDWNNLAAETAAPGNKKYDQFPDSLVVNGFGNYFNNQTKQFIHTPMAVFYVERGKRHRFRMSNIGGHFCPFEFTINDFNVTVIATDGNPIEPIVVERIVLFHGERFDFVLNGPSDRNLNETLITVRGLNRCRERKIQEFARIVFVDNLANSTKPENTLPLKNKPVYEAQDHLKTTVNDPNMDCRNSRHFCVAALQQKQQTHSAYENLRNQTAKKILLNFEVTYVWKRPKSYLTFQTKAMVSLVNRIAYAPTPLPGLLQDDSHIPYCNADHLPERHDKDIETGDPVYYCPHMIQLELGELYEFILLDNKLSRIGISHAIHVHGHAFQVIDMGTREEYFNGNSTFAKSTHLPVVKDTVTMGWRSFVKIRFRATNPGYWLMHCHLEFHHKVGMVLLLKVGNKTDVPPPPIEFPKCGNILAPVNDIS